MLVGTALSSFAALLLELALTRLFSVVLFYHFAFLAISIALLGLGAGGVFAFLKKNRLDPFDTRPLMAWLCAINCRLISCGAGNGVACSGFAGYFEGKFPAAYRNLPGFGRTVLFNGFILGDFRPRIYPHIPLLYAADLAGGALACLAVVPLLNWLGGPNTVLFTGAVQARRREWLGDNRKARKAAAASSGLLLC